MEKKESSKERKAFQRGGFASLHVVSDAVLEADSMNTPAMPFYLNSFLFSKSPFPASR
jgi:hypothetical protein